MSDSKSAAAACRAGWRALHFALAIGAGELASAAEKLPFAAPAAQSVPGPAAGTLRVSVAMVIVICAVIAAAWLMRRLRGVSGGASSELAVLAQVSLGTRERAVLLRVGARQILIGVAPGNVRTLHVVESASSELLAATSAGEPSGTEPAEVRPTFKALLLRSLGR